jgi:tRNA dimethylallyltransferase
MISNGLLDEVKHLENFKDVNALNTVGYKELFNFLDHSWSLDFAISEIKKNTRRFAKRQLTWFKKDQNIIWFDYQTNLKSIISEIEHTIQLHKMT